MAKLISDFKIGQIVVDLCANKRMPNPNLHIGKIIKIDYTSNKIHIVYGYEGGYTYIAMLTTYNKFWILKDEYVNPRK
jgi:hypothetical protein